MVFPSVAPTLNLNTVSYDEILLDSSLKPLWGMVVMFKPQQLVAILTSKLKKKAKSRYV